MLINGGECVHSSRFMQDQEQVCGSRIPMRMCLHAAVYVSTCASVQGDQRPTLVSSTIILHLFFFLRRVSHQSHSSLTG